MTTLERGSAPPHTQPLYVFGVTNAAGAAATAASDDTLAVVAAGDLVAIVSEEAARELVRGEPRIDERELWEHRLRLHEQVLERIAQAGAVLPFRFGTTFADSQALREFLVARRAPLSAALSELAGRLEWGVRCYLDLDRLARSLAELEQPEPSGTPGAAFFARKRSEERALQRARALANGLARLVHERAAAVADRAVLDEPRRDAPRAREILAATYLVETALAPHLRKVLDAVTAEYAGEGLAVTLTGPWPPYHFVPRELEAP